MVFKKIDHVEIVTSSMDRAIGFYTSILGFSVKSRRKMDGPGQAIDEIAYVEKNGSTIELMTMRNASPAAHDLSRVGYRMMAVEVEDMDGAIAFLKSKGVQVSQEPRLLGKSKRAEIKDSDGISIELRQW